MILNETIILHHATKIWKFLEGFGKFHGCRWLTFGNENLEEWFLLSARMTRKFVKRSKLAKCASCSSLSNFYHISSCFRAVQTRPLSRSQRQVGDRTSKETIIVRLKEGKKGNNQGTRQEPLRIQVSNNCSKYCDSFHLWP